MEFVPIGDAIATAKCTHKTMLRRLDLIGSEAFVDPTDNRRRLVRVDDLARLMQPIPKSAVQHKRRDMSVSGVGAASGNRKPQ